MRRSFLETLAVLCIGLAMATGCSPSRDNEKPDASEAQASTEEPASQPAAPAAARSSSATAFGTPTPPAPAGMAKATFAGGCFWCMEPPFEKLDGVSQVVSGYSGGEIDKPTYSQVSAGRTKHLEAVEVLYDPKVVSYEKLVEVFWRNIDPTQTDGQFADRGYQYTTAIFVHDAEQRKAAEASKKALGASGKFDKPIFTVIREAATFWPAEDYHQDYYKKKTLHYKAYRKGSGRQGFIDRVWGSGD